MNGIVVIDKEQNMTSHDVVAILRRKLKTKKVGHTGTLDPMATGVLPVCIGTSTKIVDYLMDQKKTYICSMVLGSATDTQDCWGEVIDTKDTSHINEEGYKSTILSFIGEIDQIPPMYSALKIGGEKLVDLARQGIEVKREPRRRHIFSISNIEILGLNAKFEVTCSKGTYIRTLCHDIGLKLGTFAHMTELRRVASEPFHISQALKIHDVDSSTHLIKTDEALNFMPKIVLPKISILHKKLLNGVKIELSSYVENIEKTDFYRLYFEDDFIGIAERNEKGLFVKKLMIG